MADSDHRYDDRTVSPVSQRSLETIGTAAAALGSAALLIKTGKVAQVSRKLDTGYRYLKDVSSLSKKVFSKDTITFNDVDDFVRRASRQWRIVNDQMEKAPINLSMRRGSFFGAMTGYHDIEKRAGIEGAREYRQEYLVNPAREMFEANFKTGNKDFDDKMLAFAQRVADKIDTPAETLNHIAQQKFTQKQTAIAEEIHRFILERHKNGGEDIKDGFISRMKQNLKKNKKNTLFNIDWLEEKLGKESRLSKLEGKLGDRDATFQDLINNIDKIQKTKLNGKKEGGFESEEVTKVFTDFLEDFKKAHGRKPGDYERLLKLKVDPGVLRMSSKGELYSRAFMQEALLDTLEAAANTLPGQLLKFRAFTERFKAPSVNIISAGSFNPILSAVVNDDKKKRYMDKTVFDVMGSFYELDKDGNIKEIAEAYSKDLTVISGRYGADPRIMRGMNGDTRVKETGSFLKNFFDIGKDAEVYSGSFWDNITSRFTKGKNKDWRGNKDKMFLEPTQEFLDERQNKLNSHDVIYLGERNSEILRVQRALAKNSYDLSFDSINELLRYTKDGSKSHEILSALNDMNDEELLDSLIGGNLHYALNGQMHNDNLANVLEKIASNNYDSKSMLYLKTDRVGVNIPGGSIFGWLDPSSGAETAKLPDIIRAELAKEAMLQYNEEVSTTGYDALADMLTNLDLSPRNKIMTQRLGALAILQDSTKVGSRAKDDAQYISNLLRSEEKFFDLSTGDSKGSEFFRDTYRQLSNEMVSITEAAEEEFDVTTDIAYDKYTYAKKVNWGLDLIKSLNDNTKSTAEEAKKFLGQFVAGRNNMQDVSGAAMYPYFLLNRLSNDLNKVGLGFSSESIGSSFDIMKAFAFKRILPAYLIGTAYEWSDDTTQAITGQGITGTFANGLANFDLATRRVLDAVGATEWLNQEKSINPIMQYWGDHTPFMSYDERKEYYEKGYDPVRSGPWWTFGGVQEARGGAIQYFTPSYARRINSDWKDEALYGGDYFTKWSHSWIPTPTNPFSPIAAALDPYWLEEMHSEDRPYVLSGQMFEEGTPWGAILNPTVGDFIKPQQEMHPWRLSNGVDIKSLLYAMNEKIHSMARDFSGTNLISSKNGKLTPVNYINYNAPTPDTLVSSTTYDPETGGYIQRQGVYGMYSNVSTNMAGLGGGLPGGGVAGLSSINPNGSGKVYGFNSVDGRPEILLDAGQSAENPNALAEWFRGNDNHPLQGDYVTDAKSNLGVYSTSDTPMSNKELEKVADMDNMDVLYNKLREYGLKPRKIIYENNEKIKRQAETGDPYNPEDALLLPEKLRQFTPSQGMDLLNDPYSVAELTEAGKGADLVREASTSMRLLGGIYGYMGAEALGLGVYQDKTLATAQDMTSISRSFWDLNIGGAGGDAMEITRRFIPEFKRGQKVNPLMNDMPDWMPDRFRYGDPYTLVPEGEMRLPGMGYEAIYDLHPDQYGNYGAFDRFKILADVAPFTPEFKMWKAIAQKTVTDPGLIEEMDVINKQVAQRKKKHDFYDYNVIGKELEYKEVDVSEVLDYGRFRSGSTIYKIAGAKVVGNEMESMSDVLSKYIHPGETVTVAVDTSDDKLKNNDAMRTVNAAVYVDDGNVAEMMIEAGDAKRKDGDTSTPAVLGRYSAFQEIVAYGSEAIAHADVPWLNDQFLRVRSPLESYKAEIVYGTPYQSWAHPIDTFVKPAYERAIDQPAFAKAIFRTLAEEEFTAGNGKWKKFAKLGAWGLSDRGAFVGGAMMLMIKPSSPSAIKGAARLSSDAVNVAHFMTGGQSMADEMTTGAYLGYDLMKSMGKKNSKLGMAAGALVGAAYRGVVDNGEPWMPDRVQDNWELEDYFDRLTYLKYMGLYHAAAQKALEEEDVDVEALVDKKEERVEIINGLRKKLKNMKTAVRLSHEGMMTEGKDDFLKRINERLKLLEDQDTVMIEGGEWTHSALIYKKAADSTVYAIDKNSSWTEIVTALPTNDREYFMEFVKERDEEKRKEILSYVSPFMQKALKLSWGVDDDPEQESNESFFRRHGLPDSDWAGWAPQVDLKDVEVKTIENEAMNLSDFGFYDSQGRNPSVIAAPELEYGDTDPISIKLNLEKILRGRGLSNIDINVSTANSLSGTQIMTDLALYTKTADLQKRVDDELEGMA